MPQCSIQITERNHANIFLREDQGNFQPTNFIDEAFQNLRRNIISGTLLYKKIFFVCEIYTHITSILNIFLIRHISKKIIRTFRPRILRDAFYFRGNQLYSGAAVKQRKELERNLNKVRTET